MKLQHMTRRLAGNIPRHLLIALGMCLAAWLISLFQPDKADSVGDCKPVYQLSDSSSVTCPEPEKGARRRD